MFRPPHIDRPKIVMNLLTRDEIELIDPFIRYHSRMGIDALIVTDNGSRDGTRDILERHRRDGRVTEIIDATPGAVFDQIRLVDRMIRRARDHYGADYCINADADEFWYPAAGSFHKALGDCRESRIYCSSYYMLPPAAGEAFWATTDRCVKPADPAEFDIAASCNLFTGPPPKVIHRTQGYRKIEIGNHGVEMDDDPPLLRGTRLLRSWRYRYSPRAKDIWIYHYTLRSIEQFQNKILRIGPEIEAKKNRTRNEGRGWLDLYRQYRAGTLDVEAEYRKVIGGDNLDRFYQAGIVVRDPTMRDIISSIDNNPS